MEVLGYLGPNLREWITLHDIEASVFMLPCFLDYWALKIYFNLKHFFCFWRYDTKHCILFRNVCKEINTTMFFGILSLLAYQRSIWNDPCIIVHLIVYKTWGTEGQTTPLCPTPTIPQFTSTEINTNRKEEEKTKGNSIISFAGKALFTYYFMFNFLSFAFYLQLYQQFPNLHVYSYGPLPCIDSVVSDACSDFVTR